MAEYSLNVKDFNSATETVGLDLTHTIVVDADNFRVRFDADWTSEENTFFITGTTLQIPMGNLNARLVYILEDIISRKANGMSSYWERKFITVGNGGDEIPFDSLKPGRSKFVTRAIGGSNIKSTDGGTARKVVLETEARYKAINELLNHFYNVKDVFDLTDATNPIPFDHPTVFTLKSDDESSASADDGKIRVFPLGGATSTQYESKLFGEDSPGAGTFTEIAGANSGWKTILPGASHEYTGLTPKLYQVRVRDNSTTKVLGKNTQININQFV